MLCSRVRRRPAVKQRERSRAFTLLEMLVVIGIIGLLLVAVIPAVNSLSKSGGRKGAISLVLNVFEEARTLAIKDGRAAYVVFPAEYPAGTSATADKNILDRYFYHSVAVFEDDPNPDNPKVQVTEWKILPTGISFRSQLSSPATDSGWPGGSFRFSPIQTDATFPYLKFNASGEVESPTRPNGDPVLFRLFEGYVTGVSERSTNPSNFDETISISRASGRATYASANP